MFRLLIILMVSLLSKSALAEGVENCLVCTSELFNSSGVIQSVAGRSERGEVNGIQYQFFFDDGNGSFWVSDIESGWDVSCKKDVISDKKTCTLNRGDLYVFAQGNGQVIVSIGTEHFPGSTVSFRADNRSPITNQAANDGKFSLKKSSQVVSELLNSNSITIRHMKWPYRNWVDSSMDTKGFGEAYSYIKWAVKRIK